MRVAFSTNERVRRTAARRNARSAIAELPNEILSPLFQAVVEATEEAVINSLFAAEAMTGHRGRIEALPIERVLPLIRGQRPDKAIAATRADGKSRRCYSAKTSA